MPTLRELAPALTPNRRAGLLAAPTMSCIFCRIIAREIPAKIVFETPDVLVFHDVQPVAPVHALVIPKTHVVSLRADEAQSERLLGAVLAAGRRAAVELGIADAGYRVVMNIGEHGGQSVHHMHLHVLGGRTMTWPPG